MPRGAGAVTDRGIVWLEGEGVSSLGARVLWAPEGKQSLLLGTSLPAGGVVEQQRCGDTRDMGTVGIARFLGLSQAPPLLAWNFKLCVGCLDPHSTDGQNLRAPLDVLERGRLCGDAHLLGCPA